MSSESQDPTTTKRWEGYSDYQSVSNRVAAAIDDAIDAYAYIEALHIEDARIRQREAAEARSRIVGATIKLLPELEQNSSNADGDSVYGEILERWTGSPDGDDGLLEKLKSVRLRSECPDWLGQLVRDIRKAGWEIGYLQAGRTVSESNLDPNEEQARSMFEE